MFAKMPLRNAIWRLLQPAGIALAHRSAAEEVRSKCDCFQCCSGTCGQVVSGSRHRPGLPECLQGTHAKCSYCSQQALDLLAEVPPRKLNPNVITFNAAVTHVNRWSVTAGMDLVGRNASKERNPNVVTAGSRY